ncbi:MAG TPA: zf-HC2 domain-containing protein [Blastocatellia bacterium]|nr:zf-HC2 domain-containing protein [Blastocatellia bacterium]
MNCEETQELVDAYVDRELDLVKGLEVERHLSECGACSKRRDSLLALRSAVSRVYHTPPASLQKRVMSEVHKASKREGKPRAPLAMPWRWIGVAASVVLVLVVSWSVVRVSARPSPDEVLAREVVSNHVRSLMVDHIADVPSSDQHTVKPWFNGKLNFSPPVIDLNEQGFALVGGRLDYLDGRTVAALVYKRRQHVINLFIWPTDESDSSIQTKTHQGYNVVHWREAQMSYWAVSDLNANELREFAQLASSRYSQTTP